MNTDPVIAHLLNPTKIAPARPAASVLMIRDGAQGLEVLVVQRSRAVSFARGALVFPGGRVDRSDHSFSVLGGRTTGVGDRTERAFRVAALREVFEETGFLLARDADGRPIRRAEQTRLARQYRARLSTDHGFLGHMIRRSGIRPDFRALVPFAHWITPLASPKRFDTRFYVIRSPARQSLRIDGGEIVEAGWQRPGDILSAWRAERVGLMFPTRLNLELLSEADSVAEVIALARARPPEPVLPQFKLNNGRLDLTISPDTIFNTTRASEKDLDFRMIGAARPAKGVVRN